MKFQGSNYQDDISAKVTELIKNKKHLKLMKSNDKKNLRSRSVLQDTKLKSARESQFKLPESFKHKDIDLATTLKSFIG